MDDPIEQSDSSAAQPESSSASLLKEPKSKTIGLALAAVLMLSGIGWGVAKLAFSESQPDELENVVPIEKQLADQISEILDAKTTRLYFADAAIDDALLQELPVDAIRAAAEDSARQRRDPATKQPEEVSENLPAEEPRHSVAGQPKVWPRLDTVLVDQGVVTDQGLASIAKLPDLEHLRLRLSPITDRGITILSDCQNLWLLNLPHSRLTVAGIHELKKFPRLKQLRLGSSELNNECCRAIAELKSLRGLHLMGVPVTDDGLKVLATLPHLESLYLDDSAVTESGWVWLFRNHPQLHVHVNQGHHDRDPHAHPH